MKQQKKKAEAEQAEPKKQNNDAMASDAPAKAQPAKRAPRGKKETAEAKPKAATAEKPLVTEAPGNAGEAPAPAEKPAVPARPRGGNRNAGGNKKAAAAQEAKTEQAPAEQPAEKPLDKAPEEARQGERAEQGGRQQQQNRHGRHNRGGQDRQQQQNGNRGPRPNGTDEPAQEGQAENTGRDGDRRDSRRDNRPHNRGGQDRQQQQNGNRGPRPNGADEPGQEGQAENTGRDGERRDSRRDNRQRPQQHDRKPQQQGDHNQNRDRQGERPQRGAEQNQRDGRPQQQHDRKPQTPQPPRHEEQTAVLFSDKKIEFPPINSMTGYAKGEAAEGGIAISVEIKSVNGKNLETNCRLPRSLFSKEVQIREYIKRFITRGTVNIYINVTSEETKDLFHINEPVAKEINDKLLKLKKDLDIKGDIVFNDLLQFAELFSQKDEVVNEELEWQLTQKAFRDAMADHTKMRRMEGGNISKDIVGRIRKIHENVKKVERLGIERIPVEREKMKLRIAQLFDNDEIDEQRLQTEIVILADKLDISEECVRLYSHIKLFYDALRSGEPAGRKINFILQEMLREINTIGSKANNIEISHTVVEMKEELERIREQSQNLE